VTGATAPRRATHRGRPGSRGLDAGGGGGHDRPMEILLYVLGAAALLAGLAGVVLPAVPGAALLVAGAVLVAWAEDFTRVSGWTVAACAALGAAILVTDVVAGALGAKAFGASRWAVIGAGIGLLAGMFLGLPGIVLGPVVGAIALEYARDPSFGRAMKAGVGAFLGFVLGTAVKVSLAFVLVGVLALALVL
jgi:uncharacterized protein YqgC (DUF456 family)